ncbi:MAG: HD domain-containing protein [Firmicutes bacterium]|nr:HD domain-containing protein [Bacillota bacterium]
MDISIPKNINFIINTLGEAGYEAFIVGGCVRDMLMEREPHDFDVTTSARPEQTKAILEAAGVKVFETGIKHGTVTAVIDGENVEITTYRIEKGYSDNRHPDLVEFTDSLREDLARRDFTMNAIAWNPQAGLKDYFGGQEDIEKCRIKAVGESDTRFKEDGLRILRAIRFASVLGFEIESETEAALARNKALLKKISVERSREELTKLLTGPGAGTTLMKYADIIGVVLPEILAMKGFQQRNPHHIYDVLEHSAVCVDRISPQPHLRWAALLHDVGKPDTFTMDDDGIGHFYGHGARSEAIARTIMHRLRFDTDTLKRTADLIKHHDLQIELTTKSVKKALNKLGEENLHHLILLKRADNMAQHPDLIGRQQYYDHLEALIRQIIDESQCFTLKDLAVNGNDLIAIGITEGKQIGMILKSLLDDVIEGRIANEKDFLLALAKEKTSNL